MPDLHTYPQFPAIFDQAIQHISVKCPERGDENCGNRFWPMSKNFVKYWKNGCFCFPCTCRRKEQDILSLKDVRHDFRLRLSGFKHPTFSEQIPDPGMEQIEYIRSLCYLFQSILKYVL